MLKAFEYLKDEGCGYIREYITFDEPVQNERKVEHIKKVIGHVDDAAEADKGGRPRKHVAVRIAAIHDCVTKNATEYHEDELRTSIPTWTGPYNKPVITDHNAWEVDRVVGRIMAAEMGKHAGKAALIFSVLISDKEAAEKVLDGRYSTVSIGARVKSAVCSICGSDWAKGKFCEHEPGRYYLKDDEDPESEKILCTLIMGGIQGHEVSFVTVPADENAMIISIDNKKSKSSESDTELGLLLIDNESIDFVSSTGDAVRAVSAVEESGRAIIESVMGFITMATDSHATENEEKPVKDEVQGTKTDEELEQDKLEESDEDATAAGDDADDNTDDADESANADEDAATDESDADADTADENDATDDTDDTEEDADGEEHEEAGAEDAEDTGEDAEDASEDDAVDADDAEDAPADDEVVDDEDAADESDQDEHDSEDDSENVSSVTDELRATLVTLYIERGIANGTFAAEEDVNVEELLGKSIEDLRLMLKEQAGDGPTLSEKIKALSGSARTGSEMIGTDEDKSANAGAKNRVAVRVVGKNRKLSYESDVHGDSDEGVKGVRIVKKNNR